MPNEQRRDVDVTTAGGCVIIGAGGHARVLIDTIRAAGIGPPHAAVDANPTRWGGELDGVPIVGGDDHLRRLATEGLQWFAVGVGSVGDNTMRQRLFAMGVAAGLRPLTAVHPTAIVSSRAEVGPGAQLLPGSIVNAGTRVGANVIVNSGAIVEHDCVLEDHVHVASGAVLAGTVSVGLGAHVGAGAIVRQCLRIGNWAVVGAGAVVVRDVAQHTMVAGVPARVKRKIVRRFVSEKPSR